MPGEPGDRLHRGTEWGWGAPGSGDLGPESHLQRTWESIVAKSASVRHKEKQANGGRGSPQQPVRATSAAVHGGGAESKSCSALEYAPYTLPFSLLASHLDQSRRNHLSSCLLPNSLSDIPVIFVAWPTL